MWSSHSGLEIRPFMPPPVDLLRFTGGCSTVPSAPQGRTVRPGRRSVKEFLDEWHAAIEHRVRPTTWANYRDSLNAYVLPVIGSTRLRELTPIRLNLFYARLLREGRVKGGTGLAPKTVLNVHRMLHRALADAVKWDLLSRNAASDADPPRVPHMPPRV